MLENKLDSIKKDFIKYLDQLGISPKTHKNYRSDLSHFTGWLILKVRSFGSYIESLTEAVPFLNSSIASEYKNYMVENGIASKTVNRRLSTLRHLSRFMVAAQVINLDFMDGIENITARIKKERTLSPVIDDFRSYLESEKVSPNTIKNYLSDIRQFLSWLESNQPINHSTN